MTVERRVLITGASIAGPTLAYWLARSGRAVTVVERAPSPRLGGPNLDIRGPGREVVRRMGLEDALFAATTTEQGTRFVDRRGATIASFPAGTADSGGATAELEILRGELARILVDASGPDVEYRYGDRVVGCDQDAHGVDVTFEHGAPERYDLVVFADGVRSGSREIVFPGEAVTRDLGLYTAYGVLPRTSDDDAWWRWYNATGGRVAGLRPDNQGTTRFSLSWLSGPTGLERAGQSEVVAALRATFAGAGWETPRILESLDSASELYVDRLAQVRAPRWSSGRVAMVGDAAWCATPVSGMGTTLAITGAYVLAAELARTDDHRAAFTAWDARMRPFVDTVQSLPPGTPRLAHPKTAVGLAVFNSAVRLAGSAPVRALAGRFGGSDDANLDLSDYR